MLLLVAAVALVLARTDAGAGRDAPARASAPALRGLPFSTRAAQVARDASGGSIGFEMLFLDVGQGDATVIIANGERMLIDGGRSGSLILERLAQHGITDLDTVVATHPDADHTGGLVAVLAAFTVEHIYFNGDSSDTATYQALLTAAAREGGEVRTLRRGDVITVGRLPLAVLNPGVLTGDTNNDSIVAQFTCGTVDVLLTGDAEAPAEEDMLDAGLVTDVDVLKVGHHGSRTSSSVRFLDVARPEVGVISAGRDNVYGHPHAEALRRLAAAGVALAYTDGTGGDDTVTLASDCTTYRLSPPAQAVGAAAPVP